MGLFGKKYKCNTCGASFKSEKELMEHSKVHMRQSGSNLASFNSAACGITFATEGELRQHNQRVHGMSPSKCQ